MAAQRGLKVGRVDPAVLVLPDDHDVGDRLAPGQLVAVVLVRPDEDDRPLEGRNPLAEAVAVGEVGGQAQLKHVHEAIDRAGGARADEYDGVLVGRPDAPPDADSESRQPSLPAPPRRRSR